MYTAKNDSNRWYDGQVQAWLLFRSTFYWAGLQLALSMSQLPGHVPPFVSCLDSDFPLLLGSVLHHWCTRSLRSWTRPVLDGQFPFLCQLEFKCYDILHDWKQETKMCHPCHSASAVALDLFSFSLIPPSPLQQSQRACRRPAWKGFNYFLSTSMGRLI